MRNKPNIYIVFLMIGIVSHLTAATAFDQVTKQNENPNSSISQQQAEDDDVPVLDYEVEIQKMTGRKVTKKSGYFNSRGTSDFQRQINELPDGVEPLPTNAHFWVGLSALPVGQSTTIVLGEITGAAAHLSDDRTEIYSEFSVNILSIFKDAASSVKQNSALSIIRPGGSVQFRSGRINKYSIARQGMPQKGARYIFFLKQIENNDYLILTGYKLSNGKVVPLDGEDNNDPKSNLPFAKYRGDKESSLLKDLQTTLQSDTSFDLINIRSLIFLPEHKFLKRIGVFREHHWPPANKPVSGCGRIRAGRLR